MLIVNQNFISNNNDRILDVAYKVTMFIELAIR